MRLVHEYSENKNVFSERLKESMLMAGSLRLSDNQFHIAGPVTGPHFRKAHINVKGPHRRERVPCR